MQRLCIVWTVVVAVTLVDAATRQRIPIRHNKPQTSNQGNRHSSAQIPIQGASTEDKSPPVTTSPITDFSGRGSVSREGCSPPEVTVNGSAVPGGGGSDFTTVQEVQFLGMVGPQDQKRICKIKCLNGVWVGPLCTIDEDGNRFQHMMKRCLLSLSDPVLIARNSEGNILPTSSEITLAHGVVLEFRCGETGLYKFIGNRTVACQNGQWSSPLPSCEPTTMQRNFSIQAPPSILYHVSSGDAGVTKDGDIVVFPGSIVHFDCLYHREFGNPEWQWSTSHRQYPSGWAIAIDERSWKYRLSVYYAKEHDSGTYTCTTPNGATNEINVIVQDVHCPTIQSVDHNRVMAVEGNKMHSKARFACIDGFNLVGVEEITCMASGEWSEDAPHCENGEVVQCPTFHTTDLHLFLNTRNKTYGTRLLFSCPVGFKLVGPAFVNCLQNGTWSDPSPSCEPITCKQPLAPRNGRILDSGRYQSGDFVQYTCNAGHIIIGDSISVCNDHGTWSNPAPTCKPACEFPGEPNNGHVIPTKFHYDIGEVVVVGCNSGYRVLGYHRLRCTASGHWSSPLPHCRPYSMLR